MRKVGLSLVFLLSFWIAVGSNYTLSAQEPTPTPTVEELQQRIQELEAENQELRDRLAALAGGGQATASTSVAGAGAEIPSFGIGEGFTTGNWSITVTNVWFSPTAQSFETINARGVFVLVELSIVNQSTEPAWFPYEELIAKASGGQSYKYNSDATIGVGIYNYGVGLYDELQPGLAYTTAIVFDVPPDAIGLILTSSDHKFEVDLGI